MGKYLKFLFKASINFSNQENLYQRPYENLCYLCRKNSNLCKNFQKKN